VYTYKCLLVVVVDIVAQRASKASKTAVKTLASVRRGGSALCLFGTFSIGNASRPLCHMRLGYGSNDGLPLVEGKQTGCCGE
jgi:hypothetical protein